MHCFSVTFLNNVQNIWLGGQESHLSVPVFVGHSVIGKRMLGRGGCFKLALLIFAQTISIPVWYRYGFLSFLAVFERTSAKEHIFDSYHCIAYLLG